MITGNCFYSFTFFTIIYISNYCSLYLMETDCSTTPLGYLTSLMNSLFDESFKAETLQTDPIKFFLSRESRESRAEYSRPPLAKPISDYVSRMRASALQSSTSSALPFQQSQVATSISSCASQTQSAATQTPGPTTTSRGTQTPSSAAQSSKRRLEPLSSPPPQPPAAPSVTGRIDHTSLHGALSPLHHFSPSLQFIPSF